MAMAEDMILVMAEGGKEYQSPAIQFLLDDRDQQVEIRFFNGIIRYSIQKLIGGAEGDANSGFFNDANIIFSITHSECIRYGNLVVPADMGEGM